MSQPDLNASVYEAEVNHRMEHVWKYLQSFRKRQQSRAGRTIEQSSVVVPLWNLRALQDESRQVGHKDLAELCAWMEQGIMALATTRDDESQQLIAEIDRVGEYVRQRAHADTHGEEMSATKRVGLPMEANIA